MYLLSVLVKLVSLKVAYLVVLKELNSLGLC